MPLLDHRACRLPELARALPEGSMERLVASKCLRQYWHLIFDPCPALLDLFPPDGKAMFEPFLAWADDQALSLDWSLHLHLLAYLRDRPLPVEAVTQLLAATASRWTRTDLSPDLGILLAAADASGEAILAWKCSSLTEPKQVFQVAIDHPAPVPAPAGWITLADRGDPAAQALGKPWTYRLQ